MEIYVVQEGDSVDAIARRYGVNVETVIQDNQIVYPYRLAVGQALLISESQDQNSNGHPLISGGYAYPFISPWVLEETLPYLSRLYVFSYGFTPDGNLIPPMASDDWMVSAIRDGGVVPFLTLTPIDGTGHFNNNLVTRIVRDETAKRNLIGQLLKTMGEKEFGGIDIDFEYVNGEDRELFVQFVADVRSVMSVFGYTVTVALAPKTSADQVGLLYEGIDYSGLGQAADEVLLMTYEWGYTYGPPMAVAPINMVKRVVDYAVSEIPREKINLGIPNYGYDWALPYERGVTKARTIGNIEAVQLAIERGVTIQFDPVAQSPFFRYWSYGVQHEVWFEDVRSMKAKFDLIREYGLLGTGYWQLMQFFKANWLLLDHTFQIRR